MLVFLTQLSKPTIPTMLHILRVVLAFLSLYAGVTSARYGCRQCKGIQTITFATAINKDQATLFMRSSLGECATGNNEYLILSVAQEGNTWTFGLKIWRYCGNGGSNYVDKGKHSIGGITATADERDLDCFYSVECHGTCHCDQCGC